MFFLKKSNFEKEFNVKILDWDRSGFDWMREYDLNVNVWLEPCHEKGFFQKKNESFTIKHFFKIGICDGIMDMFTMALDYELLSDSDYFIGTFTRFLTIKNKFI